MKTILLFELFVIIQILVAIFIYEVIIKDFIDWIGQKRRKRNASKDKS